MSQITLVDLAAQADEVARHTYGWTEEQFLQWLSQYGEVRKVLHPYDNNLYSFRSYSGIQTGFRITDEGGLIIIGEHTTYRPR